MKTFRQFLVLSRYLLVTTLILGYFPQSSSRDVGVDDDYYLNFPVSFSCPWPLPNVTKAADDGTDDYYGASVPRDYPAFIFFYAWMIFITVAPLFYFLYNNKLAPNGEVKPFLPEVRQDSYNRKEVDNTHCSQSGLKRSVVGLVLYAFLLLTMLGLQLILLLLVMAYYFILDKSTIKQNTPDIGFRWSPFRDGPDSLNVFIIAWAISFGWVAFFKRPQSLYCVFLRRCELTEATNVAIFIPDSRGIELLVKEGDEWAVTKYFRICHDFFDKAFACIFSEPDHNDPGQIGYCKVLVDEFGVRYFEFQMRRYNYNAETDSFVPAQLNIIGTASDLIKMKNGLSFEEENKRTAAIGPNVISTSDASFVKIAIKEFSRIFYVYQNFMAWSWMNYSYWHMGIVNTLVYSLGGITVSAVNYQNAVRLKELCRVEGTVDVLRDGTFHTIDQSRLVPGDVIAIESGPVFCDMVVLTGETVVDESSLTGESMPIVKTALDETDPTLYDPISHHKHHTIFAGTTVINQDQKNGSNKSNKGGNIALVVKTGSYTMKGELLREMFFGKPKKFKFDMEVNIVLLILLCYAIFAFSMTIYFLNSQPTYGFFFAIYVVASALPPLLPTVFIVSEGISADRLLRKRVAVTDPHKILMAGKVRVAFFDKTGTLTEQGLEFHSVVIVKHDTSSASFNLPENRPQGDIARGMGVCHGLRKISGNNEEGTLLGNVIDRKMFQAVSQYEIISGFGATSDVIVNKFSENKERLAIIKQYDFDNKRKTQTVIVKDESSRKYFIYVKGTGEALKAISQPHSIPSNFDQALSESAKTGMYQLSIGIREVTETEVTEILSKSRDDAEQNMKFLGFINFINPMKKDTPEMIRQLKQGNIRTAIISGDHILTALYIARESGMLHPQSRILLGNSITDDGEINFVDEGTNERYTDMNNSQLLSVLMKRNSNIELALLGSVWDYLWEMDKVKATNIAHFIRVIGRCSPHTKVTIVDAFNRDGFITLMCGDGGNDCGALKTAHVGVALSDAEASVVAPFTSLDKTITSVVDVLKEGRCALASAFSSYKYMIMYGQIETLNQMICAWFSVTFSEWCWVFMDGFWVITMAFTLPYADVAKTLAPTRPTSSILGPHTLASVLGVLAINFCFVVLALGLLYKQDFYQCRKWDSITIADVTAIGDNYESSVVFLVSGYQYMTSAMAFNFGYKYRAGWIYNWRFLFFVMTWTIIHFTVILYPSSLSCYFRVNCENDNVLRGATNKDRVPIQNPWGHTLMPLSFREDLLIIVIMNGLTICLYEYFIVNGPVADWFREKFHTKDRLHGGIGYTGEKGSDYVIPSAVVLVDEEVGDEVENGKKKQRKGYESLEIENS